MEAAERWRAAALAARKAGLALPDPEPYRAAASRRVVEDLPDDVASVAWSWWQKFYPSESSNPERVDDVASHIRLHLIPFFAPRVDHIGEITYEDCEDFVDFMAGVRPKSTPKQTVVAEARELTLAEAAAWCNKSKSAVRKAWLTGKFLNGHLDTSRDVNGVVRIPIGDLIHAGYVPDENAVEVPVGHSKKQVNAMLSQLRQIFMFAMGKRLLEKDPSTGIEAKDPAPGALLLGPNAKSTEPVHMFDLAASKSIANGLHIHHQMAFWIMRCVGTRISETFGITLGDIYHFEGQMTIRIWRQGGKTFKVLDEHGRRKMVNSKNAVKSKSSKRVLPIARPVAQLIDLYIETFHEGETDMSTPLVRTNGGAGQSAYRDALEKATVAAHLGVEDVGFRATPHTYRKFFATDLDDISPRARSVYMGHKIQNLDGGAAITESTYTLQRKGVQHLLVVAETMTSLIEASIISLVESGPAGRLLPISLCPDPDERARALEVLDAGGFIGIIEVAGEEVIEVAHAAELLGLSRSAVAQLARDGVLVRHRDAGAGRSALFGVTMTSAQEHMALAQQSWSRKKICLEFNLAYHQVDYLIKTLGVDAYEAPASRGYRYLDSEVNKIRRYLDEKAEVSKKAASLDEVAKVLSCSPHTARKLLSLGRLERDEAASAIVGLEMVSRTSLERLKVERDQRRTLPVELPPGSIPIREAEKRTGLNRVEVLELKSEGVVIHRTADYQFHVDEASLDKFLNSM
jgi:integrase